MTDTTDPDDTRRSSARPTHGFVADPTDRIDTDHPDAETPFVPCSDHADPGNESGTDCEAFSWPLASILVPLGVVAAASQVHVTVTIVGLCCVVLGGVATKQRLGRMMWVDSR